MDRPHASQPRVGELDGDDPVLSIQFPGNGVTSMGELLLVVVTVVGGVVFIGVVSYWLDKGASRHEWGRDS